MAVPLDPFLADPHAETWIRLLLPGFGTSRAEDLMVAHCPRTLAEVDLVFGEDLVDRLGHRGRVLIVDPPERALASCA